MASLINLFVFNELLPKEDSQTKDKFKNSSDSNISDEISDEDYKSNSSNTTVEEIPRRSKSQKINGTFDNKRKPKKNSIKEINEEREINILNKNENFGKSSIENELIPLGAGENSFCSSR
jgi:hypothetical protein